MRVPVQQRRRGLRFNITPLIDIVFLLIIFFLVASHFVRSESTEQVDLPTAASVEDDPPETPKRLVVTVTADGTFHVRDRVMELAELEALIATEGAEGEADLEVRIRADRRVTWDRIEPVMTACARAGIGNFRFAVIRDEG